MLATCLMDDLWGRRLMASALLPMSSGAARHHKQQQDNHMFMPDISAPQRDFLSAFHTSRECPPSLPHGLSRPPIPHLLSSPRWSLPSTP